MKRFKRWIAIAGVGLAVLMVGVLALPAAAAGIDAAPALHRGGVAGGPNEEYLAEALGITVDELEAAKETAAAAALDEAVAQGLLTQEQADALQERGRFGFKGAPGPRGFGAGEIDHQALLADALNISVDELQTAHKTAQAAMLADAVAEGRITQEQADLMEAHQALRSYLDEQGLRESMRALHDEAVQDAVEAGVITQEQADDILSNSGFGMRGFEMRGFDRHGGFRGMPGRGGFPGQGAPQSGTRGPVPSGSLNL